MEVLFSIINLYIEKSVFGFLFYVIHDIEWRQLADNEIFPNADVCKI